MLWPGIAAASCSRQWCQVVVGARIVESRDYLDPSRVTTDKSRLVRADRLLFTLGTTERARNFRPPQRVGEAGRQLRREAEKIGLVQRVLGKNYYPKFTIRCDAEIQNSDHTRQALHNIGNITKSCSSNQTWYHTQCCSTLPAFNRSHSIYL